MTAKCPRCNTEQPSDAWICTSCGFNIGMYRKEHGEELPADEPAPPPQRGGSGGWEPSSFSTAERDRGHYNAPRLGVTPPRRPDRPHFERPEPTRVHSYMWEAVFITVLCCNPIGIIGIINAARATGLAQAGDGHGAQRAAEMARNCVAAAVILQIIWWIYRWYTFDGST